MRLVFWKRKPHSVAAVHKTDLIYIFAVMLETPDYNDTSMACTHLER